jgi:hypothetical protein
MVISHGCHFSLMTGADLELPPTIPTFRLCRAVRLTCCLSSTHADIEGRRRHLSLTTFFHDFLCLSTHTQTFLPIANDVIPTHGTRGDKTRITDHTVQPSHQSRKFRASSGKRARNCRQQGEQRLCATLTSLRPLKLPVAHSVGAKIRQ